MAQATVQAAGTTAATSTDITVANGATIKIGIDCAGAISPADTLMIFEDTPLGERPLMQLNSSNPSTLVVGGTYRVKRPVTTASIAVFTE